MKKISNKKRIVFASQDFFFFSFPNEFENCSFRAFEKLCWDFDGDCIGSIDTIGRVAIFHINSANL